MSEYSTRFVICVKTEEDWERLSDLDLEPYNIDGKGEDIFPKKGLKFIENDCCMEESELEELAEKVASRLGSNGLFVGDTTNIDVDPYNFCVCACGKYDEEEGLVRTGYNSCDDSDFIFVCWKVKISDVMTWIKASPIELLDDEYEKIKEFL